MPDVNFELDILTAYLPALLSKDMLDNESMTPVNCLIDLLRAFAILVEMGIIFT